MVFTLLNHSAFSVIQPQKRHRYASSATLRTTGGAFWQCYSHTSITKLFREKPCCMFSPSPCCCKNSNRQLHASGKQADLNVERLSPSNVAPAGRQGHRASVRHPPSSRQAQRMFGLQLSRAQPAPPTKKPSARSVRVELQ